jgi:hypothetical protein
VCVGHGKNVWTIIIQPLNKLFHHGRTKSLVHASVGPHTTPTPLTLFNLFEFILFLYLLIKLASDKFSYTTQRNQHTHQLI